MSEINSGISLLSLSKHSTKALILQFFYVQWQTNCEKNSFNSHGKIGVRQKSESSERNFRFDLSIFIDCFVQCCNLILIENQTQFAATMDDKKKYKRSVRENFDSCIFLCVLSKAAIIDALFSWYRIFKRRISFSIHSFCSELK